MTIITRKLPVLLFLAAFLAVSFSPQNSRAQDEDYDVDEYLSSEERKEIVDDYKNQLLNDGQVDLRNNQELQDYSDELDAQVETAEERKRKEDSSKTIYKFRKEQPSPEESVPRLWLRP